MTSTDTLEADDLLAALGGARRFLRYTVRDLTDEQAGQRTTASELCLGGLIKHVTTVERMWTAFIVTGPSAIGEFDESRMDERAAEFAMQEGDTLAGVLDAYEQVARHTEEVVRSVPDLSDAHPLPPAPWFPPGTSWSARRALLHIIGETTQHAGHADIIRESLDGAKTMG